MSDDSDLMRLSWLRKEATIDVIGAGPPPQRRIILVVVRRTLSP
jgi:hypothetical protein